MPLPLSEMPLVVRGGLLVQLALAFLCCVCLVGLRFLRGGAARFWTAPATTALVLLPLAAAAGITTLSFRQTLAGIALTGAGGVAAIAAGSAESLVSLILALVAALAFVGLLSTSIGSSRAKEGAPDGGVVLPLASLVAIGLTAGLVVLVLGMVTAVNSGAGPPDPEAIVVRWRLSFAGSAVLALVLPALALVTALRAPSPTPEGVHEEIKELGVEGGCRPC